MGERAPLLARAVGGKVLGPRPGLAIVSFWQGILEIVLRTLALVSDTAFYYLHYEGLICVKGLARQTSSYDRLVSKKLYHVPSCLSQVEYFPI